MTLLSMLNVPALALEVSPKAPDVPPLRLNVAVPAVVQALNAKVDPLFIVVQSAVLVSVPPTFPKVIAPPGLEW